MTNTNNSTDKGGDDEAMRLAFEAFMLTGKKPASNEKKDDSSSMASSSQSESNKSKKKKKKKKTTGGGSTPPKPKQSTPSKAGGRTTPTTQTTTTTNTPQSKQSKSDRKRYYQILRTFNDKVQHKWLELDDQMLSVLQNIVNIRGRLPLEWKLLQESQSHHEYSEKKNPQDDNNGSYEQEDDWKYNGFLGKPKELPYSSYHLQSSDIQLALSNDLSQHEKMLAGLRSLISNMAECHDALGRVVDTLWKFHFECSSEEEDYLGEESLQLDEDDGMQHIVDCATDVYHMLSMELYRKQTMVPLILESSHDDIFGIDKTGGDTRSLRADGGSVSSLQTARVCHQSWKRSSEESCIDENLILYVSKLGEISPAHQAIK